MSERITRSFVEADLPEALRAMTKEVGRNIYVGPTVRGSVTLELKGVPLEEALQLALGQQDGEYGYELLDGPYFHTVIVAPRERLAEICSDIRKPRNCYRISSVCPIRMEYLVEEPLSLSAYRLLQSHYPGVEFTEHPLPNGIYARGARIDLLMIKRELNSLEQSREASPDTFIEESLVIHYRDIDELRAELCALVPDVILRADKKKNVILAQGAPAVLVRLRALVGKLDRPKPDRSR